MGQDATRAVLVLAVCCASGEAGSVWWEWWDNVDGCVGGDSDSLHVDWVAEHGCLSSHLLRDNDPLRLLSYELTNASTTALRLRCFDPDDGGENRVAKDDRVEVLIYGTDACRGEAVANVTVNSFECAGNETTSLIATRIHCSRCRWLFRNASAPPYFLQAAGVVVFLTFCILLNFFLQDKMDRCAKVISSRCGKKATTGEQDEVVPGVLVSVAPTALPKLMTPKISPRKKSVFRGRVGSATPSLSRCTSESPLTVGERSVVSLCRSPSGLSGGSSAPNLPLPPPPVHQPSPRVVLQHLERLSSLGSNPLSTPLLNTVPDYRETRSARCDVCGDVGCLLCEGSPESPDSNLLAANSNMCVVCGRDGLSGEYREKGWKCIDCVGKAARPYLLNNAGPHSEDSVMVEMAMRGDFGRVGGVVGRQTCLSTRYLLVAFRQPRAILRSALVDSIRVTDEEVGAVIAAAAAAAAAVAGEESDGEEGYFWEEWKKAHQVNGGAEEEARWATLCEEVRFTVVGTMFEGWVGVELEGAVYVWLPEGALTKVGDCGLEYVRVAGNLREVHESWKQWKDFEHCVGRVHRYLVNGKEVLAEVKFLGGATIPFPVAALTNSTEHDHLAESLLVPQPLERRVMMAVFVASAPPLLAAKALFLIVLFLYSVVDTVKQSEEGRPSRHTMWNSYQAVYFRLFNSGYPSLMADCGTVSLYFLTSFRPSSFEQFAKGVGVPSLMVIVVTAVLSLPGVVTHVVPMFLFYAWMWVPLFAMVFVLVKHIKPLKPRAPEVPRKEEYNIDYFMSNHRGYLVRASLFYLFFRFVLELLGIIVLQTNFNYGVLVYEGFGYLETIGEDYKNRQLLCVFEKGLQLASFFW
eukprot:Sspe_Gene.41657::Locus_20159_Transcript_1_1_Confidence_1.000_Length_4828::g.41657::m.41657